ncbi:MAG: hypothetical protein JXA66_00945 [Oligoflexia bacterium]|nr:hypothetical protein [Oligoflexia bacterium]
MTERRESERLSMKDVKIQLIVDEKDRFIDPVQRDVRDISYKGLSFFSIKDDYVKTARSYRFILTSGNKSLMGRGRVLYLKNGFFGMAFSRININYIQAIFEFLDPAYAGEHMHKKVDEKKGATRRLRYESVNGSFIEYGKSGDRLLLNMGFYDRNIEWSSDGGLSVFVNDEITGKRVIIPAGTSVLDELVWQFRRLFEFARVDKEVSDLFGRIVS